ncbi:hypothetical protein Tco_1299560 [Tanacetum coccineum]
MENSVPSSVITGPAFAELMELSGERKDVRRRLSQLHAMIREMEPVNHRLDIVDGTDFLRDAVRRENGKLASLA